MKSLAIILIVAVLMSVALAATAAPIGTKSCKSLREDFPTGFYTQFDNLGECVSYFNINGSSAPVKLCKLGVPDSDPPKEFWELYGDSVGECVKAAKSGNF